MYTHHGRVGAIPTMHSGPRMSQFTYSEYDRPISHIYVTSSRGVQKESVIIFLIPLQKCLLSETPVTL